MFTWCTVTAAFLLKQALKDDNLNWVLQAEQLGTGHAMQQAAPFFADDEDFFNALRRRAADLCRNTPAPA